MLVNVGFCLLLALAVSGARKECVGRHGVDTVYCVCNATYCDDLPPLAKQDKGSALVFETSKSGNRFKESALKFVASDAIEADDSIVLTVDRKQQLQKWFGLGAAFTDAAVINIDSLPKELAQQVIKDYFASTGIEFSVARIPIAGTDFSTRVYTYDDSAEEDFDLKNWKLQDEDIQHKIPNVKLAQSVSPHKLKLFGSPWVTPKWLNNKTDLKDHGNGAKRYQAWANYMIKFLDAYKQNGIDIWGMTMQNEPKSFDSMFFVDPTVERDFVTDHLGPALVKAGYTKDKFNLMVYDDGSPANPVLPYVNSILSDPETQKYVNGIAYHCYLGSDLKWTADMNQMHPQQFIMMTECCHHFRLDTDPPTPSALGDWGHASNYIGGVFNNIVNNVQGWTEWNLALDLLGHPNRDKKAADAPLLIDAQKKEYLKNPDFYALGQFSKFIAPDSQRIGLNVSKTEKNFEAVAFDRPDGATTVVVANLGNQAVDFVINDPEHGKIATKIQDNAIQSFIYWK